MTERRVLFAIRDPQATRQPGLAKAVQVARARGASLELFHALTGIVVEHAKFETDAIARLRSVVENDARECLEHWCEAARKKGVEANAATEWDRPAYEAVVRRAEKIGAELIIAECHRGARTRPWLIHLNDWELLRTSKLPVLLLKNDKAYRRPVVLAAVDPARSRGKPDGLDARLVAAGRDFAQTFGGSLHVMHASHPSIVGLDVGYAARQAATSWSTPSFEELEAQERAAFETFRDANGVPPARAHLVSGDPARAIPRVARKVKAGVVVMGALSRSGLARVFIGNTAERVLQALPCDVLVVHP